ncbi:TPA: excisionase [Legionella pneumophila]|nr:excisionase [Legionella pneumophila]HAU0263386.1 excisionase [Legionella pneumophila]HAU0297918.1 excisionase [Legionella pneumophila]HAU0298731.1 excisionase [Legionella pneumophila]HAU1382684.1 excisionase [Legionella pneumophila]
MNWVKLKRYCQISGDTSNAVHAKRKRGMWLDGVQCKIGPDGNIWINLVEVERWVENGNKATNQRLRAG